MNDQEEREIEIIAAAITRLPDPPAPAGFVEEAMQRWRAKQQRQAMPMRSGLSRASGRATGTGSAARTLALRQKLAIAWGGRLWLDCLIGLSMYAAGLWLIMQTSLASSLLMPAIAGCIPLLAMLISTARHVACGMSELARSLRFSVHWYLQARMLLAGLLSLAAHISAIPLIYPVNQLSAEWLARLLLLWCIPTLINAGIGLLLTACVRHVGQLAALLAMVPLLWLLLHNQGVTDWVAGARLSSLALVSACSALVFYAGVMLARRIFEGKGRGGIVYGA